MVNSALIRNIIIRNMFPILLKIPKLIKCILKSIESEVRGRKMDQVYF